MNLATNLENSAFLFPNKPAVREDSICLSYKEFNAQVNRIATGLIKLGVKPRDLVGLCAPNSLNWLIFYFGILKTGATAVTLPNSLMSTDLAAILGNAKPRIIFTTPDRVPTLEQLKGREDMPKTIISEKDCPLTLATLAETGSSSFSAVQMERDDTAAILYTGGTTGLPKGVMLTHEGMNFSSHAVAYCERSSPEDFALCFQPFNHVFGQVHVVNSTIYSGGCLELLPTADLDRILALTEAGRVTKFFSVPTVYVRLLGIPDLKKKLGKVKYCFSAAASMPREVVNQWKDRTGINISESLGMTEAMPISFNHYYPEHHMVGSVGQPISGVEIQIRSEAGSKLESGDRGEICVRGRNVMKGYLNNPEATKEAFWEGGWLRTGDIGKFDENGYLYIVDRLKELIITGGENVYPREVEEAIYTIPQVEECAVVGMPDQEWGERVVTFVKLRPGHQIRPDEMKAILKQKIAAFKVPKEYVIVDSLPKSPAGKLLKRQLKEQYTELQ
jgi:long-chain acyl-CoA synthetase